MNLTLYFQNLEMSVNPNTMKNPNFILRMPNKEGELGQVTYEERPIPELEPHEVLVEVSVLFVHITLIKLINVTG